MQQHETLQERVYNDILTLICEGELPDGAALPTLAALGNQYRVSENCVRAVILRLKENGYLSTQRGRAARVTYQPAPDAIPPFSYSCDIKQLSSFYEMIEILFPSIYTAAAMACTQSQLDELHRIISLLSSDKDVCLDFSELNIRFAKTVLSAVKNQFILYIVQTVMQRTVLPAVLVQRDRNAFTQEYLQSSAAMHRIYFSILDKDPVNIKKQFWLLLKATESMAQKVTRSILNIPESEHQKFAALQQASEFKYLLIAHDLYEKMLEGNYPVGTFLPTISQTREAYHAATVTVQSAYRVLSGLNIIKTIHGCGSRVNQLGLRAISDFDAETSALKTHEYLETIELLQIICGDILLHAHSLPFLPLKQMLLGELNPSHQYSSLILCRYLMKEVGSPALDTFYKVLSRRLYWGASLTGAASSISTEEKHKLCMEITNALDCGSLDEAVTKTKELLAALCHNARQCASGSAHR